MMVNNVFMVDARDWRDWRNHGSYKRIEDQSGYTKHLNANYFLASWWYHSCDRESRKASVGLYIWFVAEQRPVVLSAQWVYNGHNHWAYNLLPHWDEPLPSWPFGQTRKRHWRIKCQQLSPIDMMALMKKLYHVQERAAVGMIVAITSYPSLIF